MSFGDTFNIGLYFGLDKPILGKKPAKNCRRNQKRNTEKPKGLGWVKSGKTSGKQFLSISVCKGSVIFNSQSLSLCKMGLTGQTRLLLLVAFVHLPFSLRSLDLVIASLLFMKGASYCVVRRK